VPLPSLLPRLGAVAMHTVKHTVTRSCRSQRQQNSNHQQIASSRHAIALKRVCGVVCADVFAVRGLRGRARDSVGRFGRLAHGLPEFGTKFGRPPILTTGNTAAAELASTNSAFRASEQK